MRKAGGGGDGELNGVGVRGETPIEDDPTRGYKRKKKKDPTRDLSVWRRGRGLPVETERRHKAH